MTTPSEDSPGEQEEELNIGPYGLRGKDTPPLGNMFRGYAIIFTGVIILPFLLFVLIRFVIL